MGMNWKKSDYLLKLMISLASSIKINARKTGGEDLRGVSYLLLKTHASFKQLLNILKKFELKEIPFNYEFETLSDAIDALYPPTEELFRGDGFYTPDKISNYIISLTGFRSNIVGILFKVNKKYKHVKNNKYIDYLSVDEERKSVSDIKKSYIQAKGLVDDIFKDSESIKIILEKLHLQQNKINDLEQDYRHALTKISLNEDDYESKRSAIEKGFYISSELIKNHKSINDELEQLKGYSAESIKVVKRLNDFTMSHNKKYEKNSSELESLTLEAKKIMGDASAAKIGEHFKIQYDASRRLLALWPTISGVFLMCAILICLLTVFPELYVMVFGGNVIEHTSANAAPFLISRLLVAPLFLAGAWFCATQYIKQKNITEDYAYKKVLSLSLLSIKAEVEKTGEANTSEFIRAIQGEIVKSPLDSLDKSYYRNEIELLRTVQSEAVKNIIASSLMKERSKKTNSKSK
ncbi:TPA: hypothetical protein KUN50_000388 [Serratia marcescens]|nr:hypothetical protein [Serratia marcescens]